MIPYRTFIRVHDSVSVRENHSYDFNCNGIRILSPTSCTVTEESNGNYICELEHPIDEDGAWKSLQTNNLLSVPIMYHDTETKQLFRITTQKKEIKKNGRYIKVTAYHIFYDLSARAIESVEYRSYSCYRAISGTYNGVYKIGNIGSKWYSYNYSSDITQEKDFKFENISLSDAILGDDASIVNLYGGEIYRDNLYFSINSKKEGSIKHPTPIAYSLNMTDIEYTEDWGEYINWIHAYDNFGNWADNSYVDFYTSSGHIVKIVQFNYEEDDMQRLKDDMYAYFNKYASPVINIKVGFADLSNTELYKDFASLKSYEVGDTVDIKCEPLGITTEFKIVKTVYDVMRRKKISIELGTQKGSIIREPYLGKTAYKSPPDVAALRKTTVKSEDVRKIQYLTEDEYAKLTEIDPETMYAIPVPEGE